mgnify:FL=1
MLGLKQEDLSSLLAKKEQELLNAISEKRKALESGEGRGRSAGVRAKTDKRPNRGSERDREADRRKHGKNSSGSSAREKRDH